MKLSTAWKNAWRAYRAHPLDAFLFLLLELVLRLMACAPLLLLAAEETRLGAALSVLLFVLIVPPARQNAAEVMRDALHGGRLFTPALVSCRAYGRKLAAGVNQTLLMLLWGAPLLAGVGLAVYAFKGLIDGFTLLRTISSLGGGSTENGIKLLAVLYALTLLPLAIGFAFHSGRRHAVACGDAALARRHRGGVMLAWLTALAALLPFVVAAGTVCMGYVSALMQAVKSLGQGRFSLPPLDRNVYLVAAAVVVLLLPAIPLKQLVSAAYVDGLAERKS